MPEKTEAQKRAQKHYMEKFSIARVRMDRDKYEAIQTAAAAAGQSVNAYINQAIDARMEAPVEAQRDGVVSLHSESAGSGGGSADGYRQGLHGTDRRGKPDRNGLESLVEERQHDTL